MQGLPEFLGGAPQPAPMMSPAVAAPNLAQSQGTTGFFGQANSFLSDGLALWKQYEEVQAVKDLSGQGQKEHLQTVQQQAPTVPQQTPAQQMKQKLAGGLQMGVAAYGAIAVVGIAAFWLLTRRK